MRRMVLTLGLLLTTACRSELPDGDPADGGAGAGGGAIGVTDGSGGDGAPQGAGGASAQLGGGPSSTGGSGGGPSSTGPSSTGGSGGGPSVETCYAGHADCADACQLIDCCAGDEDLLAECMTSCEQSMWIESHQIRCLALRVFWIDEEGCGSIVDTYEAFDLSDDCTGEPP